MRTWWMINLLGEQGHSLIFMRDAMLLFLNLRYEEVKMDQNLKSVIMEELPMIEKN